MTTTTSDRTGESPGVDLLALYRTMVTIRLFEEKVGELFSAARIYGAVHLYLGQESVAAGACDALKPGDYLTSTHRGHGHCIAKGGRLDLMLAELFGKATGYCKGKGGSMHIADLEAGILGANGIVGGGIPIATGAALGCKLQGNGRVVLCMFSDGASNQGSFHESLNLAAVLSLPVIYLCENNQWAVSTPASKSIPIANVADRSASYGMPGVIVDGNNVLAVRQATQTAVERARSGQGPTLIEAKTYRWEGHFRGDPQVYRSQQEVNEWRTQRDPITLFEKVLEGKGLLNKAMAETIRAEVHHEIQAAIEFAESSPEPDPEQLYADLYVDEDGRP